MMVHNHKYNVHDRVFIIVAGRVLGGKIKAFYNDDLGSIKLDTGEVYIKLMGSEVFKEELDANIYHTANVIQLALKHGTSLEEVSGKFFQEIIDEVIEKYPEKMI